MTSRSTSWFIEKITLSSPLTSSAIFKIFWYDTAMDKLLALSYITIFYSTTLISSPPSAFVFGCVSFFWLLDILAGILCAIFNFHESFKEIILFKTHRNIIMHYFTISNSPHCTNNNNNTYWNVHNWLKINIFLWPCTYILISKGNYETSGIVEWKNVRDVRTTIEPLTLSKNVTLRDIINKMFTLLEAIFAIMRHFFFK